MPQKEDSDNERTDTGTGRGTGRGTDQGTGAEKATAQKGTGTGTGTGTDKRSDPRHSSGNAKGSRTARAGSGRDGLDQKSVSRGTERAGTEKEKEPDKTDPLLAVKEPPKKKRATRRPRATAAKNKDAEDEGKQTAAIFLALIESLAVARFGENGAMLPHERAIIEDPLSRTFARYADKLGGVEPMIDPIMLIAGFGLYLGRLRKVSKEKEPEPVPPANANGRAAEPINAKPNPNEPPTAPPEIFTRFEQ